MRLRPVLVQVYSGCPGRKIDRGDLGSFHVKFPEKGCGYAVLGLELVDLW